jgi:hypothetical protein
MLHWLGIKPSYSRPRVSEQPRAAPTRRVTLSGSSKARRPLPMAKVKAGWGTGRPRWTVCHASGRRAAARTSCMRSVTAMWASPRAAAATGGIGGGSDQRQAAGNRYCALLSAAFLISPPTPSASRLAPAVCDRSRRLCGSGLRRVRRVVPSPACCARA